MIFDPRHESKEDVKRYAITLRRLGVDFARLNLLTYYAGTEIYKDVEGGKFMVSPEETRDTKEIEKTFTLHFLMGPTAFLKNAFRMVMYPRAGLSVLRGILGSENTRSKMSKREKV